MNSEVTIYVKNDPWINLPGTVHVNSAKWINPINPLRTDHFKKWTVQSEYSLCTLWTRLEDSPQLSQKLA